MNRPTLKFRPDGTYKILCVSDLHATMDSDPRTLAALCAMLDAEQPDLVLLGGDIWNAPEGATPEDLRAFFDRYAAPMEERGIAWAHVYGNHDHDWPLDILAAQAIIESYPHCVSGHTESQEVDGTSNFVLPIHASTNDRIAFAVWGLDTHNLSDGLHLRNGINLRSAYRLWHLPVGTCHWDFVHFNQLRWYYNESERLEKENGAPIDALMLMHAPILEFGICMSNASETHLEGDVLETLQTASLNGGVLATVLERGDVRAIVSGHMHQNTFSADYCGIKLCFDGALGYRGIPSDTLRGGRIFEIDERDPATLRTRYLYARELLN